MQGMIKHRKASYQRDFDIARSWIPSNKDITESMLSYSKRMSDFNKNREQCQKDDEIELPLLIKATHLPHPSRSNRSQQRNRDKHNNRGYTYRATRSLPNIKLEPLLGSRAKYNLQDASLTNLKSIKGVKLKFLNSTKVLEQLPAIGDSSSRDEHKPPDINQTKETQKSNTDNIHTKMQKSLQEIPTEAINKVANELSSKPIDEPDQMSSAIANSITTSIDNSSTKTASNKLEEPPENSIKSKLRSLGQPRKNKRMKFRKSQLEAIEEDDSENLLQRPSRSSSYNKLPLPLTFNSGTADSSATNSNATSSRDTYLGIQQSLKERRKDVAMLRKITNSSVSKKMSSQLSMQALAKKKLRHLPPLAINTTNTIESGMPS